MISHESSTHVIWNKSTETLPTVPDKYLIAMHDPIRKTHIISVAWYLNKGSHAIPSLEWCHESTYLPLNVEWWSYLPTFQKSGFSNER